MRSDQLATSLVVQPDRRYLRIAQELLEDITHGEYAVGARLPADREIALRTGVSRATVREALLVLQVIGIVEASVGAGVYVASSTPRLARDGSILEAPAELIETRLYLEPLVAFLCAQRMDAGDVNQLRELVDSAERLAESEKPFPGFSDLSLEFHSRLAQHCGNRMLGAIASQLVEVNAHPLWVLLNQSVLRTVLDRKAQVEEHRAVLEAIARRDPAAAAAAMRSHLDALGSLIFDGNPMAEASGRQGLGEEWAPQARRV
jgi:DNA-binding FadR family transcriptional regulator